MEIPGMTFTSQQYALPPGTPGEPGTPGQPGQPGEPGTPFQIYGQTIPQQTPTNINITLNITGFQEQLPEPPTFRRLVNDVTTTESQTVQLDCIITGYPFPQITWLKDDQVIQDSPDFQYIINGNRVSLLINVALPEDTGDYTCRATNPYGTAVCTCRLTVRRKYAYDTCIIPS